MKFVVLFEDDPRYLDQRQRYMAAHLTFLEHHAAAIEAAGPLLDPAAGDPAGGLWLVEAEDPGAVMALVQADPLWPTGLRKAVQIRAWRQVFREGAAVS